MIICYTGNPGGGKTTALAFRAMKAIQEGRLVFSNINIKGTHKITLEDPIKYRIPEGSVVIIDEAGRWFNSHNWKTLPPEVYDTFTMHRHLQMDMYIAVMSFARIDKSLRECIELTYWAKNSRMLPFHKYEGFYDLEKVGSMRRDYDISHTVWKTRKVRGMFNTYAMKNQFAHKDELPLVMWDDFVGPNKKYVERLQQQFRIYRKKKKRSRSISLAAKEQQLFMQKRNDRFIRVHSDKPQLRKQILKRGILYKTPENWVSIQAVIRIRREKRKQEFMKEWIEENKSGFKGLGTLSKSTPDEEKKSS